MRILRELLAGRLRQFTSKLYPSLHVPVNHSVKYSTVYMYIGILLHIIKYSSSVAFIMTFVFVCHSLRSANGSLLSPRSSLVPPPVSFTVPASPPQSPTRMRVTASPRRSANRLHKVTTGVSLYSRPGQFIQCRILFKMFKMLE